MATLVELRGGALPRVCRRGAAALLIGALLSAISTVVLSAPAPAATATVSCSSDQNLFNTGFDSATGGILPDGSQDTGWEIGQNPNAGSQPSSWFPQSVPTTATSLPPLGTTWVPATVGNVLAGTWAPSPYGNANWVTGGEGSVPTGTGDYYYRFDFNMSPSMDPSVFLLRLDLLADNSVAEVYVNGQAQSPYTYALPQGGTAQDPYALQGYRFESAAALTLDHSWQAGVNSIVVQVKSSADYEGFDAQAEPTAICPVNLSVTATASVSSYQPGGPLSYRVVVSNSGTAAATGLTVLHGLAPALASGGFSWTCIASSGSVCSPSGQGSNDDTGPNLSGVSVAPGGNVTYLLSGVVPPGTSGSLDYYAEVNTPLGTQDPGCSPFCRGSVTVAEAVQPSAPELAGTGSPLGALFLGALLLSGAGALLLRRRRRLARRS